ncbi:trigger factor [Rickettsiales bacterium]|nr:trigger factor [Rickettsiales bacterium]
MSTNFEEITSQGLKREYKIVVASEVIKKEVDENLNKALKSFNPPGFRSGKAPISLIEKMDKNSIVAIREKVVEKAVRDGFKKLVDESNLEPVDAPKIELSPAYKNLEKDLPKEDLEFTAKFEVMPNIDDYNWSDLTMEDFISDISDEEIKEKIAEVMQNHKNFVRKKDKISAMGDMLKINFEGRIKNKLVPGCKGENVSVELLPGKLLPEFEEKLIGRKEGDKLTFGVILPPSHPTLAGKSTDFAVEIIEIYEDEKISDTDSFCKKLGYKNEDELKKRIEGDLQRECKQISRTLKEKRIIKTIEENFNFELPAVFLKNESLEENQEQDEKNKNKIRLSMVLDKISRDNGITVTAEDLKVFIAGQAISSGSDIKQLANFYKKNPNSVAETKNLLLERKIFDFIMSKVKKMEKKISYKELKAMLNTEI